MNLLMFLPWRRSVEQRLNERFVDQARIRALETRFDNLISDYQDLFAKVESLDSSENETGELVARCHTIGQLLQHVVKELNQGEIKK